MPLIQYQTINLRPKALATIEQANAIIAEFAEQGFDLTLRQLFYQFVARDLIPNTQREYKNLGTVINDGRLAGLVDWDTIVDRTRSVRQLPHWESPKDIVKACAKQFNLELWKDQPRYVEVWIEKDALIGVIEGVCRGLDVPHFSCRGYTSQSEMWGAAQRIVRAAKAGDREDDPRQCIVFHLGDHDPSGVDMTRDVQDRLQLFAGAEDVYPEVRRLALNMDQVRQYGPPPNPAKITDSRSGVYIRTHGRQSWELDALDPRTIAELIESAVRAELDEEAWAAAKERQADARVSLAGVAEEWARIMDFLEREGA